MRCVGPYSASSLFAKGLAWEYGQDAGSGIPDDGPVADPMPDTIMMSSQNVLIGMGAEEENGWIWRRLGGLMVYVVMIVFVGLTLAVGSRLPEVPWAAADDDVDEDEGEGDAERETQGLGDDEQ